MIRIGPIETRFPQRAWPAIAACLALWVAISSVGRADVAQEPPFHRLPLDGALVQNTVVDILQDRRGLMWFGTLGGLDVYDGYTFRTLSSDPRSRNALSGVHVSRLFEDARGDIWVAGFRGWLNRVDPGTEIVHRYPATLYGDDESGPASGPTAFHETPDGTLWVGTAAGLHRYLPETDEFRLNVGNAHGREPLPPVWEIADAGDGTLWLATPQGLVRFDPASGERRHFRHDPENPASLPSNALLRLLIDESGRLWIGTLNAGLARKDPGVEGFRVFRSDPSDPHSLASDVVYDLLQDDDGRIWVANQSGGLSRFLSDEDGFAVHRHDPDDPGSLASNDIWSLAQDRSGLIWIGTAGQGLNQINPLRNRFRALEAIPYNENSLTSDFVWDLAEDASGMVWMATLAGLERYDPATGRIEFFAPNPGQVAANQMQSLAIDASGRIWVGAVDGSLYEFDPGRSAFTERFREDGPDDAFDFGRLWTMRFDGESTLWVAGTSGLYAVDADRGAVIARLPASGVLPLGPNPVRVLARSPDGTLWAGGGGIGLFEILPSGEIGRRFSRELDNPESLSHEIIRSLHFDEAGELWVGTMNGLNRISAEDLAAGRNRFRVYTTREGLPNNTIYGILPGTEGRLWLSTNRGVSRFRPSDGRIENFGIADGLPSNEMNGGAELRTRDGHLYFGGVRGVAVISPADLPVNRTVPGVTITGVSLGGRRLPLPQGSSRDRIRVPYGSNDMAVEFAVTDYHQPEKNRFRYRLAGASGVWQTTTEPRVMFNNLEPGGYRFEVRGAHGDGVWSEGTAGLSFQVQPPWWRSTWAWLGYALALLTALAAYHRAQRSKLVRERGLREEIAQAHSLAEANHRLALRHARTDQLTQLPNRTSLVDELAERMRERRPDVADVAVLLINLDRFQRINDSFGHGVGDRVLRKIAKRLERFVDDDDFLARVGSDEFAWLTDADPGRAFPEWAEEQAEALNAVISRPFEFSDPPIVVTATLGCARYQGDQQGASDLLGQADVALHVAKADHEFRVRCYEPAMSETAQERLIIEARLKRALEADEFSAVYQPLVDAASGRLQGLEALIRWHPPGEPPIYPDRFIPVAEQSGLIVDLGGWMIRHVCRQVADWGDALPPGVKVAINVSMRQLRGGTLVPTLRRALADFGVAPARLKVEITESGMMENVEDTAEQLADVRRLGVEIAVDDFGTGFSSLGHLKRLPVNELKIDRSFVMDIFSSEESRTIVRSVVRLAHELDLRVVAEGVEDTETLDWLAETGCDLAQGYHFSRPLGARELADAGWLSTRREAPTPYT
ncbi:MAG: EAL domain-containing protein [Wenzhouxiangellaceae bacterium]|nr:EAL domain-containing protein [Wenzhouxiangellaceae bacterium]